MKKKSAEELSKVTGGLNLPLDFKLPLVVRFQGTNASEGRDVINNSDLRLISIDDFTEAAKKVVDLAKG